MVLLSPWISTMAVWCWPDPKLCPWKLLCVRVTVLLSPRPLSPLTRTEALPWAAVALFWSIEMVLWLPVTSELALWPLPGVELWTMPVELSLPVWLLTASLLSAMAMPVMRARAVVAASASFSFIRVILLLHRAAPGLRCWNAARVRSRAVYWPHLLYEACYARYRRSKKPGGFLRPVLNRLLLDGGVVAAATLREI